MRQVNPEGVLLRALELRLIQRRSYYVQGPLSLWHRRKPQINKVIITLFTLHGTGRTSVYSSRLIQLSEERTIIPQDIFRACAPQWGWLLCTKTP